ncbi:MAG: DUF4153 domain-containing protein [Curvibacter sp.]|nr:MAG: DUF4153 domain-containing protein [Curvibacter sp.]
MPENQQGAVMPQEAQRGLKVWGYGLVGLFQGAVLWSLQRAIEHSIWPGTSGPWLGAAFYLTVSVPVAWYLAAGGWANRSQRMAFALMTGGVFTLLGAHAGQSWVPGVSGSVQMDHLLAAGVMGFMLVPLASGYDGSRRRFDYQRLFEHSWRNAILLPAAAALTLIFWMLLWAGAWLLESIGLDGFRHFLTQRSVAYLLSAGGFGVAIGLALGKAELLKASRQFSLSVNAWFLPLALTFALLWVLALPFTGTDKLFATHNTAFYLLWFGALVTCFTNAAFQDGCERPAYPHWLALVLSWAWLTLIPLALLADWALAQRILQHGWSISRIWACVAATLFSVYVAGYALSLFKRSRWMASLPATNITAAIALIVIVTTLISPVADVSRIAVNDQLERLHSGKLDPSQFDWNFLRFSSGQYGRDALKSLAQNPSEEPRARQIATLAEKALALKASSSPPEHLSQQDALDALKNKVSLLPHGTKPDEDFMKWLASKNSDWDERSCLVNADRCALWKVDLDGDGQSEMVLLWEHDHGVNARAYVRDGSEWKALGHLEAGPGSLAEWKQNIDAQELKRLPQRWPDLQLGPVRIKLRQ